MRTRIRLRAYGAVLATLMALTGTGWWLAVVLHNEVMAAPLSRAGLDRLIVSIALGIGLLVIARYLVGTVAMVVAVSWRRARNNTPAWGGPAWRWAPAPLRSWVRHTLDASVGSGMVFAAAPAVALGALVPGISAMELAAASEAGSEDAGAEAAPGDHQRAGDVPAGLSWQEDLDKAGGEGSLPLGAAAGPDADIALGWGSALAQEVPATAPTSAAEEREPQPTSEPPQQGQVELGWDTTQSPQQAAPNAPAGTLSPRQDAAPTPDPAGSPRALGEAIGGQPPAKSEPAPGKHATPARPELDPAPGSHPHLAPDVAREAQPVPSAGSAARPQAGVIVVSQGDSLWNLAASLCGPDASPGLIDRTWRAIYDLNREVIGADPNLIHPGQHLLVPQEVTP